MHLLILPFIITGLSAKLFNRRFKKQLQSNTSETQLDIIITSFFTDITPTDFGDFKNDKGIETTAKGTASTKDKLFS